MEQYYSSKDDWEEIGQSNKVIREQFITQSDGTQMRQQQDIYFTTIVFIPQLPSSAMHKINP